MSESEALSIFGQTNGTSSQRLVQFAFLVAAAEREECAKVAEVMLRHYTQAVTGVPEAIRARSDA